MFISDSEIKNRNHNLIEPFFEEKLGPISYDLTADAFCVVEDEKNRQLDHIELLPGEAVFVSCKEIMSLPNNMSAIINIRNSKLRQGLSLEAPIYYPGHKTRVFFKITNTSKDAITVEKGESYAAVYFMAVSGIVEAPYAGVFKDEFDFRGMATYRGEYVKAIRKLDEKKNELKSIEHTIYANVLVLMTIFVALFSLININVNLVKETSGANAMFRLLVFNLGTVASIAMLISFANLMFEKSINKCLIGVGAVCFMLALFFATWI